MNELRHRMNILAGDLESRCHVTISTIQQDNHVGYEVTRPEL